MKTGPHVPSSVVGLLFLLINDLRKLSLNTLNMIVFLEVIYRFNVISVKSTFNNVLCNTRKNNPEINTETQKTTNSMMLLRATLEASQYLISNYTIEPD